MFFGILLLLLNPFRGPEKVGLLAATDNYYNGESFYACISTNGVRSRLRNQRVQQ